RSRTCFCCLSGSISSNAGFINIFRHFFLMLLTLGLDSSFGGSEAIITALSDEFPLLKRHREYFVGILFTVYMFIGIAICTKGGILIMEWLIVYGTSWGLLIAVFCETIVISFIYGHCT
ncbi:hypothetical protein WUBG_12904, partial [Wuchereria bancrofti]